VDVDFERSVTADPMTVLRGVATTATVLSERRWRVGFDGSDEARVRLLALCQQVGPVTQFANSTLVLEEAYLELIPKSPPST
jgi:hypothetical protein